MDCYRIDDLAEREMNDALMGIDRGPKEQLARVWPPPPQ